MSALSQRYNSSDSSLREPSKELVSTTRRHRQSGKDSQKLLPTFCPRTGLIFRPKKRRPTVHTIAPVLATMFRTVLVLNFGPARAWQRGVQAAPPVAWSTWLCCLQDDSSPTPTSTRHPRENENSYRGRKQSKNQIAKNVEIPVRSQAKKSYIF